MVKTQKNGSIETNDLFEIFMDNDATQLENQLLQSKRKFINAKVY